MLEFVRASQYHYKQERKLKVLSDSNLMARNCIGIKRHKVPSLSTITD